MLHVLQYRYPKGPPMGMCSGGTGARSGLDTGGMIPGSIKAVIHRVMTVKDPRITQAQKTVSVDKNHLVGCWS